MVSDTGVEVGLNTIDQILRPGFLHTELLIHVYHVRMSGLDWCGITV